MYRNTLILIAFLSVIAALLFGINIGKRLGNTSEQKVNTTTPLPSSNEINTSANPSPISKLSYFLQDCGLSFAYPSDFSLQEASQAAILNKGTPNEITVVCVEEIPKPPLTDENIEEITVDGISGQLFHDSSAKDGTPVDVVILSHPSLNVEVGFFGHGEGFDALIKTVKFTKKSSPSPKNKPSPETSPDESIEN